MDTNQTSVSPSAGDTCYSNRPSPYALSRQYWGIDWQTEFPWTIDNKFTIEATGSEATKDFLKKYFAEINGPALSHSPFLFGQGSPAREYFYAHLADHFVFAEDGKPCGIFIGNASDWSTYYLRYCAIRPQAQGHGLQKKFYLKLFALLASRGVERIEGEISPSNLGQIHTFNSLGFNVVGVKMSERWGGLVQVTKYLNPKNEAVFLDQFCAGPRPLIINSKQERRPL